MSVKLCVGNLFTNYCHAVNSRKYLFYYYVHIIKITNFQLDNFTVKSDNIQVNRWKNIKVHSFYSLCF